MGISIWQILVICILFFLPALLSIRILNKAGYSRWWAALFIIPIVNTIMVWVFASAKWPALIKEKSQDYDKEHHSDIESSNSVVSESRTTMPERYHGYEEVPWHRKSGSNSLLILLSFLTAGIIPGVLLVCIFLLTGDVYFKEKDENGHLKKWGLGNKILAVIILLANIIYPIYIFTK